MWIGIFFNVLTILGSFDLALKPKEVGIPRSSGTLIWICGDCVHTQLTDPRCYCETTAMNKGTLLVYSRWRCSTWRFCQAADVLAHKRQFSHKSHLLKFYRYNMLKPTATDYQNDMKNAFLQVAQNVNQSGM